MNDDSRRKRRRRRRLVAVVVFIVVALGVAWVLESQATTTVIVVRYADVADSTTPDSPLTPAGRHRAEALARLLGELDVITGVDAIFATQHPSTQETANPLAEHLGVPMQIVDARNIGGLRDMIRAEYKGRIVLVVTDRDAIPRLIRRLRGRKNIPPIADGEYDNVYIVTIPWYGKVKTLRLRYGEPYAP